MKKFRIKELRKTDKGEEFVVETIFEALSLAHLIEQLQTTKKRLILNDPYSIKEIKQ